MNEGRFKELLEAINGHKLTAEEQILQIRMYIKNELPLRCGGPESTVSGEIKSKYLIEYDTLANYVISYLESLYKQNLELTAQINEYESTRRVLVEKDFTV